MNFKGFLCLSFILCVALVAAQDGNPSDHLDDESKKQFQECSDEHNGDKKKMGVCFLGKNGVISNGELKESAMNDLLKRMVGAEQAEQFAEKIKNIYNKCKDVAADASDMQEKAAKIAKCIFVVAKKEFKAAM